MNLIYATLNKWKADPFIWGETDCMMVLADWLVSIGHTDPAKDIRGTYDDKLTCERNTKFLTDPLNLASKSFEGIGLKKTETKAAGDVGVVLIRGQAIPFGALWTGTCWASKTEHSSVLTLKPMMVRPLAVWGAGYAS